MCDGSDDITERYAWGNAAGGAGGYVDDLVWIGSSEFGGGIDTYHWILQGPNYDVRGVIDSTGDLVERYTYTPYGQRRVYTSAGTNDPGLHARALMSQRVNVFDIPQPYPLNPFGHQGLMHDETLGLIYNRNRMLEARLGRFIQPDPMGYIDGLNRHQYEGSEPVGRVDWDGYQATAPSTRPSTQPSSQPPGSYSPGSGWQQVGGPPVITVPSSRSPSPPHGGNITRVFNEGFKQLAPVVINICGTGAETVIWTIQWSRNQSVTIKSGFFKGSVTLHLRPVSVSLGRRGPSTIRKTKHGHSFSTTLEKSLPASNCWDYMAVLVGELVSYRHGYIPPPGTPSSTPAMTASQIDGYASFQIEEFKKPCK